MVPQNATGESLDVCGGSQTNGTCVQQYATCCPRQHEAFYLLASGSNWKITMGANQGKCLGPNNNGTANDTTIVVQDCNGSTRPEVHRDADVGLWRLRASRTSPPGAA